MTDSQHKNVFEDIQALCSDFRRQWKKGNRPRIEDYVSRLDKQAQQTLASEFRDIVKCCG